MDISTTPRCVPDPIAPPTRPKLPSAPRPTLRPQVRQPIPVQVLRRICFITQHLPPETDVLCAVADMIITTFFFLLRPGEYTGGC